ncbi:cytochrome c3 family protein [Geothrix sp. SG200]|uniref:cytochrome c3 family protein n=1 Tax=Geothrix sp. SG200 TaxID=2922865 RepID=UPI001FADE54D|nr:cytochrome c3 family protein [Geothrix sp. SG200]
MIRRLVLPVLALGLLLRGEARLLASDPPHNSANNIQCVSCHKLHKAPGGTLTTVSGNVNLCLSCHSDGAKVSKALYNSDQSVPASASLVGSAAGGTSHRWDSSAAGRLIKTTNNSTATITPSGDYTGAYPATIMIKVDTTLGATTGKATVTCTQTIDGTTWTAIGTSFTTSTTPQLLTGTGVSLAFSSTGTFAANDVFYLYVRPDLVNPTSIMATRLEGGKMMCSTCHDQHLQANAPFDPTAPGITSGTGSAGRHFQRVRNDDGSMCGDCHAPRNVGKGGTSHPVNLPVAGAANTKAPTTVPLTSSGNVHCLSCHDFHGAPTTTTPAGMLLRVSNSTALCTDCHTLADTTTANTHTNSTSGILWPGDGYGGSTYYPSPGITDTTKRGACMNCHTPHGWPDANNPGGKYANALGAEQDNLCETCHDGTPAKDVRTQIIKTYRHPVDRNSGRTVGCADCHNPHMAVAGVHAYGVTTPAMTVDRNRIRTAPVAGTAPTVYSGAMKGVDGVKFNYSTIASNWAVPVATTFSKLNSGNPKGFLGAGGTGETDRGAEFEYQVCFKCHTSYDSMNSTTSSTILRTVAWGGVTAHYNAGTAKFTNGSTAVVGTSTTWTTFMAGMYIQKNITSPAYRIASATATSITLATPYAGTTDASAAGYTITKQETDLAQEFNPKNASFHPVVAGAAAAGSGSSALTAAQMKAPWATNLGTQTMLCSDCHNTEAASPAAQGPHGSANRFMLRGTNVLWPATTAFNGSTLYNTTFCSNCHTYASTNVVHAEHTGRSASGKTFTCTSCHLLVPHGGKLGRLIATNTAGLPKRYAVDGDSTNVLIRAFVKASTPGGYSKSNCGSAQSGCTTHSLTSSASNSW